MSERALEGPDPKRSGSYREITLAAVVTGVLIGVVLNAAVTYSGLKIGFTLGGSAIAAVLGWGVLRGILRRGTIVENNIAQTIASSVNTSNSGVIFTVPVLFMLGMQLDYLWLGAACVAGAILGVAFIIPTRKQMIDFDRLRFPTGTAVASVLRSPGEGVKKSLVLLLGIAISMIVFFFTHDGMFPIDNYEGLALSAYKFIHQGIHAAPWALSEGVNAAEVTGVTAHTVDLGHWVEKIPNSESFWSPSFSFVWAIAPFAIGAGYITGAPGLVVLAGGILAYFVVAPWAYHHGWMPPEVTAPEAGDWARGAMNRNLGIGMLSGGALIGLLAALPALGAAVGSLKGKKGGGTRQELPMGVLFVAVLLAFGVLYFAATKTIVDGDPKQAAIIAAVGTAWMWFAGIVIAQCTGMTDWSPISGMALLTVLICLMLTGGQVMPAVLIGAAVCVAITLCADMMQDLKTGHMVGGIPIRQQKVELAFVWIGPIVCLATVVLIAKANILQFGEAFGPATETPAAQADALRGAIDSLRGGETPVALYGMGGILGILLSLTGFGGLGVLVGLSMYLPIVYLLPYGLGCLIQMVVKKTAGARFAESWGVPFAAGLIVGEGVLGVIFAAIQIAKA